MFGRIGSGTHSVVDVETLYARSLEKSGNFRRNLTALGNGIASPEKHFASRNSGLSAVVGG